MKLCGKCAIGMPSPELKTVKGNCDRCGENHMLYQFPGMTMRNTAAATRRMLGGVLRGHRAQKQQSVKSNAGSHSAQNLEQAQ